MRYEITETAVVTEDPEVTFIKMDLGSIATCLSYHSKSEKWKTMWNY